MVRLKIFLIAVTKDYHIDYVDEQKVSLYCFSFVLMEISLDCLLQEVIEIMSSHQWILLIDFEWRVCGTMGFSFTSNQDFLPAIPCEPNTNRIHKMNRGLFPSDSCQKLSRISSVAFSKLCYSILPCLLISPLSCLVPSTNLAERKDAGYFTVGSEEV